MNFFSGLIIGLIFGGALGVITMSLLISSKETDELNANADSSNDSH